MRVSTNQMFDTVVSTLQRQSSSLLHTQQQVATGRRMVTPSDDPVAAARALEVSQSAQINSQYGASQANARETLGMVESRLGAVGDVLQYVRSRAVEAGNAILTDSDRRAIATDLRAQFDELVGLANSQDGTGEYLFAGYRSANKPFAGGPAGSVSYSGDDGRRALQVSSSRQLPVSDSGADIFMRIRSGNGSFEATAAAANSGGGIIDPGSVTDPGALTGNDYSVRFSVAGGVTTYTVINETTSATVVPATAYNPGAAIAFDGMSVSVRGAPANGDRFDIEPSSSRSVFETVSRLISAVETPGGGARLANELGNALGNLDQAQENVLRVRAGTGSRQLEIDALAGIGEDLNVQYSAALSRLQDLDYAEAVSRLTRDQTALEASQKAFMRVSGMSLFNYL